MCAFAAALPFTNLAGFARERERRGEDDFARRRVLVFRVRRAEEPVARFFVRLPPPPDEPLKAGNARGFQYMG